MVQLAPGASEAPQVLDCANAPGSAPPSATLVMFRGAVPALVMVSACAGLQALKSWLPKASAAGVSVAPGDAPVPESGTDTDGVARSVVVTVSVAALGP